MNEPDSNDQENLQIRKSTEFHVDEWDSFDPVGRLPNYAWYCIVGVAFILAIALVLVVRH